jgi:GT2 family glycosyltransferase
MVDLTIVIVNYNTASYTSQCIDSIYNNVPQVSFEIALVDNASLDNSADLLEKKYPNVILVRSQKNLGIAGGNNLGIRAGSGKFVLLLNNDTIVLPGSIDCVINFLENHPEAGGVGGTLLNPDGSYQAGPNNFPNLVDEFLNITKLGHLINPWYPSLPPDQKQKTTDWISTAFMLFRRDALEEVGLVDEAFFIYSDETDLEYRLWKAGWKLYYLPDVKTIHFGGKSLEPWRSRRLKYRGRLLFCRKHHTVVEELILRIMYASSSVIKSAFWICLLLIPKSRMKAFQELRSHFEILKLSILPAIPPVKI